MAATYRKDCIAMADFTGADLKWETWRLRFSPEAEEIGFDMGDDDDE
jgi:hypothetical protein